MVHRVGRSFLCVSSRSSLCAAVSPGKSCVFLGYSPSSSTQGHLRHSTFTLEIAAIIRIEMSQQDSDKEPVTFRDITACFSKEEWTLLHEWQKELYGNVMKEINQALISLGPVIASAVFSLRAKGKEDLCPVDPQDSKRRQDINQLPSDMIANSNVLFAINHEENQYLIEPHNTDRRESNDCLSTGFPSFNCDNVLRIEQELDHPGVKGGENSTDPWADVAISQIFPSLVEQEGSPYSMDHRGSEGPENNISTGMADNTPVVSFIIKEEEAESSSMDHRDSQRIGSISNPTGNGHKYKYKRKNEECMETLETGEAVSRIDKETLLQHPWKRGTGKSLKDTQRKMRNCGGNGPTQSFECESGVRKPEHFSKQNRPQTAAARRFTCNECGKSFTNTSILITHLRIHTGEKPYTCSQCGKCFSQSSNLFTHQQMHTGLKPYTCNECGKCFSRSSHLFRHLRIHTGVKPYTCSECGKCFSRSSVLNTHQRIHTGVKPYTCIDCGKCFSWSSTFFNHQRMHTGNKPYKCSECGKCFSQSSHLFTHQKIHAGVQLYTCSECGKTFINSSELIVHQGIHTGVKVAD